MVRCILIVWDVKVHENHHNHATREYVKTVYLHPCQTSFCVVVRGKHLLWSLCFIDPTYCAVSTIVCDPVLHVPNRLYTFENGTIAFILELDTAHKQRVPDFICLSEIAPFARHPSQTDLLLYVLLCQRHILACARQLELRIRKRVEVL